MRSDSQFDSLPLTYVLPDKTNCTTLAAEDLATHTSEWVMPLSTTYRERFEIFELPPNPQGLAALQQLNILETFNLSAMGFNSADYLHTHIEAKKLAFADRAKFYADPDFVSIPIEGLLSKAYALERAALINMSRAATTVPAGVPTGHASDAGTAHEHASKVTGDTIYLTTASRDNASGAFMMVSLIQSNFHGFGSGLVVPGLGFALQDRGALFNMEETTADVYDAGKVRLLFVFTVTFRANPDHNHLTHVNTSLFFVTFLQNWKAAVSHHHSRLRDKGRRAVAQLWSHGWKHAAPRPCADHQQHGRFRHGGAGKWRRGALLPYRQLTADWKRDARRRIDDA